MSRLAAIVVALARAPAVAGLQLPASGDNSSINVDRKGPNVCMDGHFAPELYLLGVPKGGTTYFYQEFVRSNATVRFQPKDGEEPWQEKEAWVFAPYERDISEKAYWLSHFPACDQWERRVALDATPGYFGCPTAPKIMSAFYAGSHHKASLKFMVFLRNPGKRAQSHFYQYVENGVREGAFGDGCPTYVFPASFKKAVELVLEQGQMCDSCACNDIFEDSMYATSFNNYFQYFRQEQFVVVPFEEAVRAELVMFAWDMLGMPHGTGKNLVLASKNGGGETNHHDYPTLAADLPGKLMVLFQAYIEDKSGARPVAKVLANTRATLYSFGGSMDDVDAIDYWLRSKWGH